MGGLPTWGNPQLGNWGIANFFPNGPMSLINPPGLDPEKRAAPTTAAHGNLDSAGAADGGWDSKQASTT